MTSGADGQMRLVCASANPDKVAEMTAVLREIAVLLPRPAGLADVVEDAPDLAGNALLKGLAVARAAGTDAVADDTGLEVDALDGAPGVFSARFAGPEATYADNVDRLLDEIRDIEPGRRTARFRTVAMVVCPDGSMVSAEGVVEGQITLERRGDGGFGYDSVFEPDESNGLTFAEMGSAEKNAISHRGRALRSLAAKLREGRGRIDHRA